MVGLLTTAQHCAAFRVVVCGCVKPAATPVVWPGGVFCLLLLPTRSSTWCVVRGLGVRRINRLSLPPPQRLVACMHVSLTLLLPPPFKTALSAACCVVAPRVVCWWGGGLSSSQTTPLSPPPPSPAFCLSTCQWARRRPRLPQLSINIPTWYNCAAPQPALLASR